MTEKDFKYCFDNFFDSIRNFIYYKCGDQELATDIAQESFMKLWDKGFEFQETQTKGLLYKMASDLFVSHLRKNKVAEKYIGSLSFNLNTNSTEETLQFEELKKDYENALTNMDENKRTVFLMSRMEGLSYKEIAERLGLSVKAIEKRMSLALSELKQSLKNYHEVN